MQHFRTRAPDIAEEVRSALHTHRLGQSMRAYETVTSTNTLAASWANAGAPHGSVVYADYQTGGRGRLGRRWASQPGLNLTFSVVLRPELPAHRLGMVTIAASVAVSDAIDVIAAPLRASIKWPNDVLIGGRKCCGMLLETHWSARSANGPAPVVLGIGLNVHQEDFPAELAQRATSLLLETGRRVHRAELFAAVLERLEQVLDDVRENERSVRRAYLQRMTDLNERVKLYFAESGHLVTGVVLGLDESGGLSLETEAGIEVFHAGEVTRSW